MPLYDILNEFQKGHSHLAVVYKDSKETKETLQKAKEGIDTDSLQDDAKQLYFIVSLLHSRVLINVIYFSFGISATIICVCF